MLLALQDAPQVHEDPRQRAGAVPRRAAVAPSPVHQPRRAAGRPRSAPAVIYSPPVAVPVAMPPAPPMAPPAPPPPPPRPSPLPAGAQPPAPRGVPSNWVTSDDYPMAMMRAHATGVAAFELDVDTAGRVYNCRITESSGWPALDATTCSLMKRRARFNPARNAAGTAISANWSSRFRWELPDIPVAFGSWARVVRYVIDKDGGVKSCAVTNFGTVPQRAANPCANPDSWRMKALHGPGTGLVTISYAEIHRAEGMPMPAGFAAPAGRRVFVRTIDFTVEPFGATGTCTVKASSGFNMLTSDYSAYTCHTGLRYIVTPAMRRQATRKASFTVEIVTDGEVPVPRPPAPPPIPIISVPPAPPRMAPPAPPAPPPPSMPGRPPTPRGSPQAWITNDDYPAAALRAAASGSVTFRLDIDATGMPVRCVVTGSSGHSLLDNTTCSLMMRRARFNPARRNDGTAVPGSWPSKMRWELPSDGAGERPALAGSWSRTLRFTIGEDGSVSDCREERGRIAVADSDGACPALRLANVERVRSWRGTATGPVTLFVRYTQTEIGQAGDNPAPVPRGLKPVLSQRASFEIGEAGFPVACSGTLDALALPLPPIGCGQGLRYPVSAAYQSVVVTQVVMTSGDERVAAALKWPEDY